MNAINERLIRHVDLAGIGSIVGGVVDGFSSLINGRANRKAQEKENEKNRQFTEKMYNLYESPAAQAQQMREAGLNPNGAIAPTSVGSASTASLPPSETPEFGSAIQAALGLKNAKSQSKILDSQARESAANASIAEDNAVKSAIEADDYQSWYDIKKSQAIEEGKIKEFERKSFEDLQTEYQDAREQYGYNRFGNEVRGLELQEGQLLLDTSNSYHDQVLAYASLFNDMKNDTIENKLKIVDGKYSSLLNEQTIRRIKSQIALDDAEAKLKQITAQTIKSKDDRDKVIHDLDVTFKQYQNLGLLTENQIKSWDLYRKRLLNGDWDNFADAVGSISVMLQNFLGISE